MAGFLRQWPVAVYTVAGALVLAATFLGRGRIAIESRPALTGGAIVVLAAAGLLAWSYLALSSGLSLWVQPESERLIESGPYRFIRHPAYLGMIVAFLGIALAARSWFGIASVPAFMGPATLLRAGAEERQLRQKFGQAWDAYAARTGYILPGLGRRRVV